MKKLLLPILLSLLVLSLAFLFSSCSLDKRCEHVYDEGEVIREADCERGGVTKYTCTICGESKTSVTYALPHRYSDRWSSDGDRHWHNALCEHLAEITDTAAHKFADGLCTTCGIPEIAKGLDYEMNPDGKTYTVIGFGDYVGTKATVAKNRNSGEIVAVGAGAFENTEGLEIICLQQYIVSIGDRALAGCEELKTVQFASTLTYLGDEALDGCTSLSTIRFIGTVAEWNALPKGENWDRNTGDYTVLCNDGDVAKQ